MFNYFEKVKHPTHCSSFLTLDVELAKTKKVPEVCDQYQLGMAVLALLNMSASITVAKLTTTATVNAT